jgi:hypothetical protein
MFDFVFISHLLFKYNFSGGTDNNQIKEYFVPMINLFNQTSCLLISIRLSILVKPI